MCKMSSDFKAVSDTEVTSMVKQAAESTTGFGAIDSSANAENISNFTTDLASTINNSTTNGSGKNCNNMRTRQLT